jgi:hypothetical protein
MIAPLGRDRAASWIRPGARPKSSSTQRMPRSRAGAIQRGQQGQPGLHVPSQQWPPEQKSPWGQHVLPHCTRHVSVIVWAEFRMTALQRTAQPTWDTSDLQAEIAAASPQPVCVQSVPTAPAPSQKLSVTWHAAGAIESSLVRPSGTSGNVAGLGSPGNASSASVLPVAAPSPLGAGESTLHANITTADTEMQNNPIVRSIAGSFV